MPTELSVPKRGLRQRLRYAFQKRFWGLDIDPSAYIALDAYIDRTNPRGIHIASDCYIAMGAIVLSHDMTRGIRPHTRIGKGAVIGARAVIMPGVTVGEYAHVMPGAVVLRDVPEGGRVAGNPAKILAEDS